MEARRAAAELLTALRIRVSHNTDVYAVQQHHRI